MRWSTRHFDKPTPYWDEPTEFIPPGHYIVGALDKVEEEWQPGDDEPAIILKVEVVRPWGDEESLVRRIAEMLNASDDAELGQLVTVDGTKWT